MIDASSLIATLEQKIGTLAQKMLKNDNDQKQSLSYSMDTLSSKITSLDDKLSSDHTSLSESLVQSISKLQSEY